MLIRASNCQATGACADVDSPGLRQVPGHFEKLDDHELGLGPGDEHRRRNLQRKRIKFFAANEIGHRRAFDATAHQAAEGGAGHLADFFIIVSVKMYALPVEHVSQHHLGVQPWALRAPPAEEVGGPGQQLADWPRFRSDLIIAAHGSLRSSCVVWSSIHPRTSWPVLIREDQTSPSCSRRSAAMSAWVSPTRLPWITWSKLKRVSPIR